MFFGSVIVGVFAAIWFAMGMRAAGVGWEAACLGVPISALTIAATYMRARNQAPRPANEAALIGKVIGWASLFEGIAIPLAANALPNLGHAELVLPAIAIIVGLHFLPIAYFLNWPGCYLLAAAMAGVAICPRFMVSDPGLRNLATGIGAACALWVFCWVRLLRSPAFSAAQAHAMAGSAPQ